MKVNKRLTIRSENGADTTTVAATNSSDNVFEVVADYVNISGFEMTGATSGAGIKLYGANNSIIAENNLSGNDYGIYLNSSSNNTITDNSFVNDGLFVSYSYNNTVVNNTVNGKPLVYLEGVSHHTVSDAGQVILVNCSAIWVKNLDLSISKGSTV